ncbi:hypothetical protein KL86APRO_11512 [uncultured Alphaproteobacteria bacterium]|uniref:YjiS-like domain-containing protein n=1 Tax=uncultured Alphaproteobacteria bacterium TaxID=91750 RepID=A0A212JR85_9PROT|nr:hypothetical protein KL86APRO_11512 [uncultured Alphaproteobacteria bacterium]
MAKAPATAFRHGSLEAVWTEVMMRYVETLGTWERRAEQRRDLAELDDRALRDIGRSRAEAAEEAAKPFWRA